MKRIMWIAVGIAAACGDDGAFDTGPVAEGSARFAVVRTDFSSTAVALLNTSGEVTDPSVISSGSAAPGLVAALSGDVVLSSHPSGPEGVLHIVDRFRTDVLTRFDLEEEQVLGQLRVAPTSGTFSSNPHDVLVVSDDRAYVTRFGVGANDDPDVLARGNDLLEMNPATLQLTGRSVDLSPFDATVPTDDGTEVAFARPSLVTRVRDQLVVGLTLLSRRFDVAAPGVLGLVDLETLEARGFPLPEDLLNCGTVRSVPGEAAQVMVACQGYAFAFGEFEQRRGTAGIVVVEISDEPRILRVWRPRVDGPFAVTNVVPLDATTVVAVAPGNFPDTGDAAYIVDVATGEETTLATSEEAFVLGTAAYDPTTGVLLLPDTSDPDGGLLRFRRSLDGATAIELETILKFTDGPLPPYAAYLLPSD